MTGGFTVGPQAAALESALALRPAASSQDRFAIGAATLRLLAGYAESDPVAILLDDMHSIDGSSADALLFAFRRLGADPVAVPASAVAIRPGRPATRREPDPELYGATITLENVPSGQLCGTTVT